MRSHARGAASDLPTPLLQDEEEAERPDMQSINLGGAAGGRGQRANRASSDFEKIWEDSFTEVQAQQGAAPPLSESATSSTVPGRTKKLLFLCVVDVLLVWGLALAAYNWSAIDLFSKDFKICSLRLSVLDVALLSVFRTISLLVLLQCSPRRMVPGSAVVAGVCCVAFLWNAVKIYLVASSKPCATSGRKRPLIIAALVQTVVMSLFELCLSLWVRRVARREEALERLLSHVSTYTSIGGMGAGGGGLGGGDEGGRRSNVKRLVERAKPHWVWLFAGCVALLIRLPFSLSLPHFVSETIGGLLKKDEPTVRFNITCFIVAGCVDAMLDFWCVFLFGYTQHRIIRALRIDLYRNLLKQEIAFFESSPTGELSSRLTADTSEMANDLTWVFRFTIEAFVRIGGIGTYMFFRSWRLALVACAIIPFVAVINRSYGRWMAKNAERVQTALADANAVAQETLSSMRTVFSFANEDQEVNRYQKCVNRHYALNVRQTAISGLYYMGVATFLVNCCVQASLLLYGSHLVFTSALEAQTLLAFMLYQGQLQEYFAHLLNSFTNLLKSAGAGAKVLDLLERHPRIKRNGLIKLTSVEGRITFDTVRFTYPAREHAALHDVSFAVSPGEVVAFVGPSGGGKSTIFHLIEHLYEPLYGRVCLDGVNVNELDHKWLHKVVALVGQEPVLFSGSVMHNIMYSIQNEKDEGGGGMLPTREGLGDSVDTSTVVVMRVERAARIANAHDFVTRLPQGYATGVGERGLSLSGGQKQRIAIARAIMQDPRVLLLDEATSALDSESEGEVQKALERAMEGRTVLVIAHRLSTVANATRIIFINRGVLVEEGTHQQLMSASASSQSSVPGRMTYRMLIERQSKALEGGAPML